ncbi:MAG: CPBP family intramembrane metalloprotease [Rhodothermia bacterium]|nr:CPBP family intramembrane metalloprotease [Rhodothermia bacterium]
MKTSVSTQFTLMFKVALFCTVFTGFFAAFSFAKNFFPSSLERLVYGIIGLFAAFVTTFLFLRFEQKKFSDIELFFEAKTFLRFLSGVFIGLLIMGFVAFGVMYFTHVEVRPSPKANIFSFFVMTSPLILLAFVEELGFRAYPLQMLKGKVGIRLSITITSILFALYHIANGWSVVSSFLGPAVWGFLFGIAAIYAKGIALPTGIHYAANLTTSAFGTENNGLTLWTLTPTNTVNTLYYGFDLVLIIPAFIVLLIALIGVELFLIKKCYSK